MPAAVSKVAFCNLVDRVSVESYYGDMMCIATCCTNTSKLNIIYQRHHCALPTSNSLTFALDSIGRLSSFDGEYKIKQDKIAQLEKVILTQINS